MRDDGAFEILLIVRCLAFQSKKLEYHRILYDLLRGFGHSLIAGDSEDRLLIVAK